MYQAQHRLIRPPNYCRGCGVELHHLGALFCQKDDCQAIRTSWRHVRHNYTQTQWRILHLDRDREINRQSHQKYAAQRNERAKTRYWANPAVRAYYVEYAAQYHAKKRASMAA